MRLPLMQDATARAAGPRPTPATPRHPGRRPVPVPTHQRWRSATINPYLYALIGLVVIFGTIQVAKATGQWATTGRVTGSGERIAVTGTDPYEIRGWMTIEAVTTAYGVPIAEFYERFGVPPDTPTSRQLRDLEAVAPGFSIEQVRVWLAERQAGQPRAP